MILLTPVNQHDSPSISILDIASASLLLAWVSYSIITLSITYYKKRHTDHGRIHLPPDPTSPQSSTRRVALYRALLSHLSTDLHENGEPVNEDVFWRNSRLRRFSAWTAALSLVGLQIYRGTLISHQQTAIPHCITVFVESLGVALVLTMAAILVTTRSINTFELTLRAGFFTSASLTCRTYLTLIQQYISLDKEPRSSRRLAIISLAVSLSATFLLGTIPQGPERYRERSRLYNQAVAQKLKDDGGETFEGNVVGTGESILAWFFSIYMFKVVHKILQKDQVDLHELPVLPGNMQAEATTRQANESDKESRRNGKTSAAHLMWSTLRTQRATLFYTLCCIIAERALAYLPYFCLERILAVLDGSGPKRTAWAFASIYVLSKKVENFTGVVRIWNLGLFQIFRGFRAHLVFLLFRKLLTRNVFVADKLGGKDGNKALTKPDILNLVSSDVQQLESFVWTVGSIIELLLSSAIGCVFIWHLLGVSAAWGIAFSFLAYPPAYLLSKWELSLFDKSRGASDERIAAIQETVHTIGMIKMSGYEGFTFNRLNALRQKEFKFQFWARLVGFFSAAVYSAAPTLVIIISFGHFTLVRHQHLTASLAFTSIAVFAELRPALTMAPKHIADLMKEVLAVRRINTFLQTEDVEHLNATDESATIATNDEKALTITGDVTWHHQEPLNDTITPLTEQPSAFTLRDLDISFPKGKITLIAGKAGSGKTLLLLALLGEVKLLRGRISYAVSPVLDPDQVDDEMDWTTLGGGVAYVPQVAWLQSLNIRENILFGLPMNESRYKSVLAACGLIPDLLQLEEGDLVEIGERGKTLSGGQKARVSLARAMYSRADVLVLDDVLSAVDASTGRHIIDNCFLSPEMSNRTIIIASHAVESLAPVSHQAIFLEDGTSVWQGPGSDLLASEYMVHLKSVETHGTSHDETAVSQGSDETIEADGQKKSLKASSNFEIKKAPAKTPRQMLVDEKRAGGVVETQYWIDLIRLCGGRLFLISFVLLTVGSILGPVAERALLRAWTEESNTSEPTGFVLAYAGISTVMITLTVCQEFAGFYGGYRAMKTSFVHMLDRMLRAPMQFFIRTRAGSIVQRFSGDLDMVIDCAELVGQTTMAVGQAFVSLISITWFAGWRFAMAILLMVILYYRPAQNYRVSSRQVRRLKAILPGPVNAHYGETLTGAPVIRAFGAQGLHVRQLLRLTNMEQTSAMLGYMIGRWMWIQVEVFDLVVLIASFCLILTTPGMTGAKAGFIMGFAQTIATEFEEFVLCAREFDLKGVTLERLAEYRELETENIPSFVDEQEDNALASRSLLIDDTWPQEGHILVQGLHARYAEDLPDVLIDVSFEVKAGERVGIVGATGCGKSSLAKAFFSFVDITKGSIQIDDKDLSLLPLDIARGRLGIIGQDPMLVTGSLRLNLDIESSHTDEELFNVLRRIELLDQTVQEQPDVEPQSEQSSITVVGDGGVPKNRNVFEDLDYQVLNAGDNLSSGEKQLIVLARALLQKKKVLVLDEATASVDSKTDLVVTRLVHEEFKGSTILIIAHRLRTIMPCDKIIVMDKGRIVQFDTPSVLLDLGEGAFFDLCMAAGEQEFRQLRALTEGTVSATPL